MKIFIEKLRTPQYRKKLNILNGTEIRKKYRITQAVFEKMIITGDMPKPDYVIGTIKMRLWKADALGDIAWKAKKYVPQNKERDFQPCIQIDDATRAILRDTRRLFAVMGNGAG